MTESSNNAPRHSQAFIKPAPLAVCKIDDYPEKLPSKSQNDFSTRIEPLKELDTERMCTLINISREVNVLRGNKVGTHHHRGQTSDQALACRGALLWMPQLVDKKKKS